MTLVHELLGIEYHVILSEVTAPQRGAVTAVEGPLLPQMLSGEFQLEQQETPTVLTPNERVGVLRLRILVRFADQHSPLRMTVIGELLPA